LGDFLKQLEIYTMIPPTTAMSYSIVKIMIEVLSVFALATKYIKQGRSSECATTHTVSMAQYVIVKFSKKQLGESEVEAVLQKLGQLTQDEARVTVSQTLGAVHDLVRNMRVVMEGTQRWPDLFLIFF
jgi:hypothetical protein